MLRWMKIVVIGVVILTLFLLGGKYSDYRKKSFIDILEVNPEAVSRISVGIAGEYKSTTDKQKINELLHYLDSVWYTRLQGDQTAYMPMEASIIYLYEDNQVDFIVPYNDEVMISYKVYKVKNGEISSSFLYEYYQSMED